MNFLIISIDHRWQSVFRDPFDGSDDNRPELAELLTKQIEDRRVDLICEESDPCQLSVAQKIAYEHRPRVRWKNIVMTVQERLEAGILYALRERPHRFIDDPSQSIARRIDRPIPEDKIRERFFASEALREAETCGAKSVLILCGDMHANPLGELLQGNGHVVEVNRGLIQEQNWEL